ALGIGGSATDPSGSLRLLAGGPAGKALLLAVVFGLGAYSIWGFVRAIFDPLHRGRDAPGIAERLGFAWSGIAYAGIVLFALRLLAGTSPAGAHDGTQSTIAKVLTIPGGQWWPARSASSRSGWARPSSTKFSGRLSGKT